MSTDQQKPSGNSTSSTTEHAQAPHIGPFPQPFNGTFPPGYPFYAYPAPADGDGNANPAAAAAAAAPYLMAFPPGMVYAYQPPLPGQAFPPFAQPTPLAVATRAKRKQVKMACTNCAAACKRCDEARPCDRCIKYCIADTCVDGQRKERKKGLKRGPYKRRSKAQSEELAFSPADPDWVPTQSHAQSQAQPQHPPNSAHHPAILAASPQGGPSPHEGGYYQYFYPPPLGSGQQAQEGTQEGAQAGGAPLLPLYMHPPPGYPGVPFGHYAYPPLTPLGAHQQQQQAQGQGQQQQTIDPADNARAAAAGGTTLKEDTRAGTDETVDGNGSGGGDAVRANKKRRNVKGGSGKRGKKVKYHAKAEGEDEADGDGDGATGI